MDSATDKKTDTIDKYSGKAANTVKTRIDTESMKTCAGVLARMTKYKELNDTENIFINL